MSGKPVRIRSVVSGIRSTLQIMAVSVLMLWGGVGVAHPHKTLAIVNAAGDATVVAPASVASAFGNGIGASTAIALAVRYQRR